MKTRILARMVVLGLVATLAHSAQAATVTLEYSQPPAPVTFIDEFVEQGFRTSVSGGQFFVPEFTGTTWAGVEVKIAAIDGSVFSLDAIDFLVGFFSTGPYAFTVYGDLEDGSVASQAVSVAPGAAQTVMFSTAFSGLKSVRFRQGPNETLEDDLFFDNVRITTPGAVPEPATLALVGLALGAGGLARRRFRR